MSIHHATAKKAEAAGITLTEVRSDDGFYFNAFSAKAGTTLSGRPGVPAKDVLDDAIAFQLCCLEYPNLKVEQTEAGWEISYGDDELGSAPRLRDALDTALESVADQDIDIDEPAEDAELEEDAEDEGPGSVVASKYRKEYAARGNPNTCGDWLADQLTEKFLRLAPDGVGHEFDCDAYTRMLLDNGVQLTGAWSSIPDTRRPGWQGRYRMNGRQRLAVRVAETGLLHIQGRVIKAPQSVLEALWKKHKDAETKYDDAQRLAAATAERTAIEARRPRR